MKKSPSLLRSSGDKTQEQPPILFRLLSALFLLWNLFGFGVFMAAMTIFTDEQTLKAAGLNEAQIETTLNTPGWVNVAFGVAVIFGVLGCFALLLRRKVAVGLLIVSLVGVLVQNTHMYLLSNTVEVMGVGASPLVIAGAIALVPFSMLANNMGWLK